MSKKTEMKTLLAMLAIAACIFAWLCFAAFNKPQSAVLALAIASFIVGYVNGWR